MKHPYIVCVILIISLLSHNSYATDRVYLLSSQSEEYNTRYIFHTSTTYDDFNNGVYYINDKLPSSFVIELEAFNNGEQLLLLYNTDNALLIRKKRGKYIIGNKKVRQKFYNESLISLYFVNGKLNVYIDDVHVFTRIIDLDVNKQIGFKVKKRNKVPIGYLGCYEPIPFKVYDYGKELDSGDLPKSSHIRIVPENVGSSYNLSFSSRVRANSKYSTRFEYRFNDSQNNLKSSTERSRSEISGVYAISPMNKWIIEYDLFIPKETIDDNEDFEVITQIHDGSKKPTTPAFYLSVWGGYLKYSLRGDNKPIEEWDGKGSPIFRVAEKLVYLEKEKWHHVKIYIKEGFDFEMRPLTKIWVDNILMLESDAPNCYNYTPRKAGQYGYFKYGVYKPAWQYKSGCDFSVSKRVYFFDNVVVRN